jgi:cleavage and polyadenylation specificity factor subunit 3
MASKRKASAMNAAASEEPVDPSDELMFLCLGGGNEVGRSCHIVQYKGKTVMVRTHAPERPIAKLVLLAHMDPIAARRRPAPRI